MSKKDTLDITRLFAVKYSEIVIFAHLYDLLIKACRSKVISESDKKLAAKIKSRLGKHEWKFQDTKPIKVIKNSLDATKDVGRTAIIVASLQASEFLDDWNDLVPSLKQLEKVWP